MIEKTFDEWQPRAYLNDYYRDLTADETHVIRYLVEEMPDAPGTRRPRLVAFARYTLECERPGSATPETVASRMGLTRRRIARLEHWDAELVDPLGPSYRDFFATVLSPSCADSITDDKQVWARYSRKVASLVRPQGLRPVGHSSTLKRSRPEWLCAAV